MIVNTNQLFPPGDYVLTCCDVPKEENIRGTTFWRFRFETKVEGSSIIYEELCPIWLCGPLFKALQFKEVKPGSYDVEETKAMGRKLKGSIVHEEISSGAKKGTLVARLKNMTPMEADEDIPF